MWDKYAIWVFVLAIVDIILASGVTIHAVLWKRDSRAVIGWVGLAWLAPFIGVLAYLCLGINRIERKAVSLKLHESCQSDQQPELNSEERQQLETYSREHPNLEGLASVGRNLTGQPVVPGNKVEPLIDGDQAYPAMLEAIAGAKRSVALLSYIFDSDRAGDAFLDALVAAQQRNVQVRVLIDDVGSKYSRPNMVRRLKEVGLTTASFLPTRTPFPIYANLRNHRKILIVDGRIGFTGGTNIREGHWLAVKPKHPVQCLHFRLNGPVVSQMQKVFATDWTFATGETVAGDDWFAPASRVGSVWARGIEHGPDEHFEKIADVIAAGLASARQQVRILSPYFLPNASLTQALAVTAMRGVNVEIYIPSANNIAIVQWATTAQLWELLEKGCRVYYTTPPFDHTKLMIVDGIWTLLGSTNWDPRSLRLNFEFNVECYDENLAQSLNDIVDKKAESAHEVTLDEVNDRSFPVRLRDGLARLLTPYL
jgi:cardiolipin synthase